MGGVVQEMHLDQALSDAIKIVKCGGGGQISIVEW